MQILCILKLQAIRADCGPVVRKNVIADYRKLLNAYNDDGSKRSKRKPNEKQTASETTKESQQVQGS